MTEQDLLFSMDIGTRTVVGIVGFHDGEKFKILACEIEEHKERAMFDGQVHDIELVAKAVRKVKEKLEHKLDISLKNVAIAAAGRSLKTCKVFAERELDPSFEIDKELVNSLEIEGIQLAQKDIERLCHEDDITYYCVGYAVVNYYLNGSVIANLEGHKGAKAGLEVLATFLPRIVVDSLYSVIARAGLEVSSLTLEPIAAMNVSIQSNLRLLNIALVDIGAGTSDIALTKSGTVFAFAMAPVAGDEITESIAQNYLLDFDTAEKVKINLNKKASVKFKDIMGIDHEEASEDIIKSVDPAIRMLAKDIADKIMEFNGKAPSAVFLVGGGSQVPMLPEYIAEELQLPAERVGVRKTDIIKVVELKGRKLSGPEFVTPIGIAITAHLNRQKDFLQVTVNDVNVKLFNSKTLTVADSLVLVGYNPRNLIGRRGAAISFKFNGNTETVKGEAGEAAKIYINGIRASLDKPIANGDRIVVEPAEDGKPAEVHVRDYVGDLKEKQIYLDGKPKTLKPVIRLNGVPVLLGGRINDGDELTIKAVDTVEDFAGYLDIALDDYDFYINGSKAAASHTINDGDRITFEAAAHWDKAPGETQSGRGQGADMPGSNPQNGYNEIEVVVNGRAIKMGSNKWQFIFVDIFNYIDIDPKSVKGGLTMLLNGEKANYTDVLKHGDRIDIRW